MRTTDAGRHVRQVTASNTGMKSACAAGLSAVVASSGASAHADPAPTDAPLDPPTSASSASAAAAPRPTAPSSVTSTGRSLKGEPSHLAKGQHFALDFVTDTALTVGGAGFDVLTAEVLGTGEIRPPLPVLGVQLLSIDRGAVTQTIDPNAGTFSDIALYTSVGFAVLDPILSGFRDGTDAMVVDGFMYAESGALAVALTDVTKIAVRRPRPIDYINCGTAAQQKTPNCSSTDLGLSFFSGHAATVAALGATATYLAFVRSPDTPRPWITLAVATALTGFVSYERVRAGDHFPTDVIAGSMAGAAIGIMVPHLHRHRDDFPAVWVGAAPAPGGGTVAMQGIF